MSSGGTRAGTRGRNYVLPLAIVLVVGQIAAFVAIKLMKDDPKKDETTAQPAVAAVDVGAGSSVATLDVPPGPGSSAPTEATTGTAPTPTTDSTTPTPTTPDPAAGQNPAQPEPEIDPSQVDDTIKADDSEDAKRAKRELAKQKAAKEKAERAAREKAERAERAERDRREAEERRREAEAKRASDVEKARLAAEAEKARLAAEKAKAEAAAEQARLEQEKIKAAAAAKQVAATTTTGTDAAKGSSKVLVLVLGPGVSHPSREAIRNVYLGKTSVWPNGTTAHPMNRPSGSAAGRKFFGGILKMSGGEFKEHWSELQLSGGGIAPSTVSSATTMIAKVAATRGGMGYVLESELPENTNGVTLVRLK
jgi:hypothetical protein